MAGPVAVRGLRELIAVSRRAADADTRKFLRKRLRAAGHIVRDDARRRMARIYGPSAATIATTVRAAGYVAVVQRRGKVTGKRPDFGRLQMRDAFLPARDAKRAEVEDELERIVDDLRRAGGW